ncbi:transcription termination factor 5, mitochondrial-like [Adelges cooleyi]|uniref:transcription termination factor 5, mitochondrial-like n=1 Tax=Adelges cooleyi TaxID=133065 RepID=UPI00217FD34E|nr:transcription termination factor 5, mitochondrial-like [Adelges cooleyi]XP_050426160.1 transcription termination factor 5, mitochondrial-like [Adelges cooleyi]
MFHKFKIKMANILCTVKKYQSYRSYSAKNENQSLFNIFHQKLDMPFHETKRLMNKYSSIRNSPPAILSQNISYMMEYGFTKEEISKKPQVISLHPLTLKNYIMLLEESGFYKDKINPLVISRFKNLRKKSIESLKAERFIDRNINVQHHILSFLQFPSDKYPKKFNDSHTLTEVQENIFKLYVIWKIQIDYSDIEQALKVYHRLHNKSLRLIERSIDILINDLNFNFEKIKRHSYLIHSDPDNMLELLNFKELCGMDIKTVLTKHPKIILTPYESIQEIQKHLKDFGVPESALSKVPEIYTLGSNSVYERLCILKKTPELETLMSNPQVARLLFYMKKVNLRLKYLQNKNCVSLNLLSSNNRSFNRFNNSGNDKVTSNDIMHFLTSELNQNKQKLRKHFQRHMYWQYISLLRIRQTYESLRSKHFTIENIRDNVHILLYPMYKIDDALVDIQNMENVTYLRDSTGKIKSEFVLPLVLYSLEKTHHFSGNGVWSVDEHSKQLLSSTSSQNLFKDTEELDHVPSPCIMNMD